MNTFFEIREERTGTVYIMLVSRVDTDRLYLSKGTFYERSKQSFSLKLSYHDTYKYLHVGEKRTTFQPVGFNLISKILIHDV